MFRGTRLGFRKANNSCREAMAEFGGRGSPRCCFLHSIVPFLTKYFRLRMSCFQISRRNVEGSLIGCHQLNRHSTKRA